MEYYLRKMIRRIAHCLMVSFILSVSFYCTPGQMNDGKNLNDTNSLAAKKQLAELLAEDNNWVAPDTLKIPEGDSGNLIRYGRSLIANTSLYLGPKGSVKHITNGMNCGNCHLDAGTKPFGNNYSAVASTYPKFRARSGTFETIPKRVNDCIERSLNGKALDTTGKEMKAIVAYIKWLGQDVKKGEAPAGAGLAEISFLSRPANSDSGKFVFEKTCARCHNSDGQGKLSDDGLSYTYPPLWGPDSYNIGAGLYRLSRFAAYVKANMPQGTNYTNPVLTDAQAWDVAAYVNSMQRPGKDLGKDWPDISKKPFDHPYGPYADQYSEVQHKYGPFVDMPSAKKKK